MIEFGYAFGNARLRRDVLPRIDRVDDGRVRVASDHGVASRSQAGGHSMTDLAKPKNRNVIHRRVPYVSMRGQHA